MKKFVFLYCISFACVFHAGAQVRITGTVKTEAGEPVFNASVVLMRLSDSMTVAYTFTNDKGFYEVFNKSDEKRLMLTIYGFNVRRTSKIIDNQEQNMDFTVVEEAIQLREVSVKSGKMWGNNDTVNYLVDAFRDTTDVVIADVLKKMPGIEVKDDGKVEYKGKPISKFYIENMDMLQGRYNLATTSISAGDVATVQVMENHQSVRALKDIRFSDDVAMNLKLKAEAKGTFALMADLGAGWADSLLYEGSLTGMYFEKRQQYLATLKANNAGTRLVDEENITVFPLASMLKPSAPGIAASRHTLNRSEGFSFSTLQKLKNEAELSLTLLGGSDRNRKRSYAHTVYFLPDTDSLSLKESLHSEETAKGWEAAVTYELNRDLDFLKINMTATGQERWGQSGIDNASFVLQEEESRTLCAKTDLHWVRRSRRDKDRGIEVNSRNKYGQLPYVLNVTPGVFPALLHEGKPYPNTRQDVCFSAFQSENFLRFLTNVVWKRIRIMPHFGFSTEEQALDTRLSGLAADSTAFTLDGKAFGNKLRWHKYQVSGGAFVVYDRRRVYCSLYLPLQLRYLRLEDLASLTQGPGTDGKFKLLIQPSFGLNYKFSHQWEIKGKIGSYSTTPSLQTLYSGYILKNYRTLARYESPISDTWGGNASLSLAYKNVMKYQFGDLSVSYNRYWNKVMYVQHFEGNMLVINAIEKESSGDYLSFSAYVGKGFDWKRLNINVKCACGLGRNPQLIDDKLVIYDNRGWNANLTTTIALTDKLFLSNKCSWGHIRFALAGQAKPQAPIVSLIDQANFSYVLPFGLSLGASVEFYHTLSEGKTHQFILLDGTMGYTFGKVRLSLDLNNILDTKNFVYSYFSGNYSYYSAYLIRPRSLMLTAKFKVM